jgi:hypothetical protein
MSVHTLDITAGTPGGSRKTALHLLIRSRLAEQIQVAKAQEQPDVITAFARQVADGLTTFSAALDELMTLYLQCGGKPELIDDVDLRLADRLSARIMQLEMVPGEATADPLQGVLRQDMHPAAMKGLGFLPEQTIDATVLTNLLSGRKVNGAHIDGKHYAMRNPIGAYVFTVSSDISLGLAWAFGSPAEQAKIVNAHLTVAREGIAYLATEVGQARLGHAGQGGFEQGHVAWVEYTHFTARRTAVKVEGTTITSDRNDQTPAPPKLHTHFVIPNVCFCDSGRVGGLDMMGIAGFRQEVDAYTQARLVTELRQAGFEARLNEKGQAYLPAVPEQARVAFARTSQAALSYAKAWTKEQGEYWHKLTLQQQVARQQVAISKINQHKKGIRDDLANPAAWRQQAQQAGWQPPVSFLSPFPQPLPPAFQRHTEAALIAAEMLGKHLERANSVPHAAVCRAAARGLAETGCVDLADVAAVVKRLREDGVVIDGKREKLVFDEANRRHARVRRPDSVQQPLDRRHRHRKRYTVGATLVRQPGHQTALQMLSKGIVEVSNNPMDSLRLVKVHDLAMSARHRIS